MIEPTHEVPDQTVRTQAERKDFRSYVWGLTLALLLTLVPFALVQRATMPRFLLLSVIGVSAFVQMVVHFRFFLRIRLRQKREDLQLLLFSAMLLIVMVAGTIWIMASLAIRMAMPMPP